MFRFSSLTFSFFITLTSYFPPLFCGAYFNTSHLCCGQCYIWEELSSANLHVNGSSSKMTETWGKKMIEKKRVTMFSNKDLKRNRKTLESENEPKSVL